MRCSVSLVLLRGYCDTFFKKMSADAKNINNKSTWMSSSWSFDCDEHDEDKTPLKRPRTQITKVLINPAPKPIKSYDDTKNLCGLPALMKACEPRQPSELSISRQKQREICDWLDFKTTKNQSNALILSGPSGCGKTVSFKLLAKERGFECVEWITPCDKGVDENNRFTRQGDRFEDYMIRTTRYNSIFDNYSRRLLMVKDFPNVYLSDKEAFYALLEQYFKIGKEPIVFICTDSGGVGVLQTLFSPKIREQFGIDHISINAVTQTVTKNILKRVAIIFNTRASHMVNVSQQVINELLSDSVGDIRSTIINLIFMSLKVPDKQEQYKDRGREESLSLLHAVGRVINPKRIFQGDSWKFVHNPDEIAYFFQTQPSTFIRFVHENHLNTTRAIEEASIAADIISISECFIAEWQDANLGRLGLSFCIRGIMTINDKPVAAWNPIKKPPNNELIHRDLAAAEISWYKSLINPQMKSSTINKLNNLII